MSQTIQASVTQDGPATSIGRARIHEVTIDRPPGKGGEDRGAMGGELLLLALGGCFMSNLLAAARARNQPLENASVTVTATLEGTPERMTEFHLGLRADCASERLEHLATIAERGCLVSNTLAAGSRVTVEVLGEPD